MTPEVLQWPYLIQAVKGYLVIFFNYSFSHKIIAGEGMVMEPDKVAFLAMVYFRLGSELTNRNVSVHENKA